MATVTADMVDVWSAPDREDDATVLYAVPAGTLVYIDAAASGERRRNGSESCPRTRQSAGMGGCATTTPAIPSSSLHTLDCPR